MRRLFALALLLGLVSGCGEGSLEGSSPTVEAEPIAVLVFSRTAGFRHPSIADAVRVLGSLPAEEKIVPTFSEDPSVFSDAGLAGFDVVAFVNTTGDVLNVDQQGALERFVRSGRGWVGVHSAADTEYQWPWYGQLVGAYFTSHPLLPVDVKVTTEDPHHPSTEHLEPTFQFTDEIYNFDRNPRHDNAILLTIDEAGFIFPNIPFGSPSMGADHPVAWYKEFDGGRSFYTNLGHRPESWDDPLFLRHLLQGIRWAADGLTYNRIVLTGFASNPLALAVAPDGRALYVERTGEVRVWNPDTGRVTEALRLDVDTNFENGLLGIALDPRFSRNGRVYLYHSPPIPDPPPASGPPGQNVLSRFTLDDDDRLDPDSRIDLLHVPSERQCCHEGGAVAFAPDGTLFVSTGDNTNPFESEGRAPLDERPDRERFNSQRTAANPFDLRGKILRINPDGSIPAGNLFPPSGEQGRPEIYVMGTRNPFRIAVDAQTGRLWWGDVGPDANTDGPRGPRGYDEINFADQPGNYGWPYCIGFNRSYNDVDFATGVIGPPFDCTAITPPLIAYDYSTVDYLALGNALDPEGNPSLPGVPVTGRLAIAGVVYQPAENGRFRLPSELNDKLLMIDWTRDVLATVDMDDTGGLRSLQRILPYFELLRPIDLDTAPDGALYVLEYGTGYTGNNDDARLSRIEYSASGALTPVAVANASLTAGAVPLTVTFSADGSRAPGRGDSIEAYEWDVDGDGEIDSDAPTFTHTYTANGAYAASLAVVGTSGRRSFPNVVDIVVGNAPPTVSIDSPANGTRVPARSMVALVGSATDSEDGTAACDTLRWDIRLGHNAHSHPLHVRTGCNVSFPALLTGDHAAGQGTFYIVTLEYTDLGGPNDEPALTGRASIRIEVDPSS